MITFRGVRHGLGQCEVRVITDGVDSTLPLRLDVFNHSPTGFEWGYRGSGPAQLALAMLLALGVDEERAVRAHQTIKNLLIAPLHDATWEISGERVLRTLAAVEGAAR